MSQWGCGFLERGGRLAPAHATSCPTRRKSRRDGAASVVMVHEPATQRCASPRCCFRLTVFKGAPRILGIRRFGWKLNSAKPNGKNISVKPQPSSPLGE
jgi:hypothetical protein